ncbi:hypothetical protein AVEN_182369-1 [Araneus ventricosus]|uniref:Uncharacterized protein n=1 Tax=Araneus ventricosus TaxID=182803 RepID=A0A4Y2NQB4_ARAVE|nr:hypothetical protein AVEN_182369-1 [Araneus ventricosus]
MESFAENLHDDQVNKNTQLDDAKSLLEIIHKNILLHSYYAVYYDNDPVYIGKAINSEDDMIEMKFLEKGAGNFRWSKRDKIEKIDVKYIHFYMVLYP